MIDIASENLVSLSEVPPRLPPRTSGNPIHLSTVYRWIQRGIKGVRLEVICIGGTTYTSTEALQRFAEGILRARYSPVANSPEPHAVRKRQIEKVAQEAVAIFSSRRGSRSREA